MVRMRVSGCKAFCVLQVVLLLVQLWPSVQSLISTWCTDQDVVEVSG